MKFLLVAGGILSNPTLLLQKLNPTSYDCILAVDRGYDHCLTLGLTPHVLMGDMDSIAAQLLPASASPSTLDAPNAHTSACNCAHLGAYPAELLRFPPEKDDTDLRLAVDYALAQQATGIDIICATGGRLDQLAGNFSLLEYLHAQAPNLAARIIDESNMVRFLSAQNNCNTYPKQSKYISLIPVSDAICFTGEGLKYAADRLTVSRQHIISISNECLGEAYSLTLHSGKALLIEADES